MPNRLLFLLSDSRGMAKNSENSKRHIFETVNQSIKRQKKKIKWSKGTFLLHLSVWSKFLVIGEKIGDLFLEEALKQSTYDAIEDSLYREIDKDQSTGSGKRVHTGNYRMKEKSEKVTAKDANASSSQQK